MPPISTYTPSSAVGAGTRASVEAGVGGSGAQVFLSLKAMGGSEKQRTHDVRDTFRGQVFLSLKAMGGSEKQRTHDIRDTFHFLIIFFHCFVSKVAFCRNGHFYVKHSF